METRPAVHLLPPKRLDQLQEPRKGTFLVHHLQRYLIMATIEQQKGRHQVESTRIILLHIVLSTLHSGEGSLAREGMRYLQKTVDDLPAHIVGMCGKYFRGEELVRAARDVIFGEELICSRIRELMIAGANGEAEGKGHLCTGW